MKIDTFIRHLRRISSKKRFHIDDQGHIRDRYHRCPLCSVANAINKEFKFETDFRDAAYVLEVDETLSKHIADAADNFIHTPFRLDETKRQLARLRERLLNACGLKERKVK